jgi:hypothetical protein
MNEAIKLGKTKTVKGWVAMNKGEYDIENVSFYKSYRQAVKDWGKRQVYRRIKVIFYE